MDISRLAAKQKRVKDWETSLNDHSYVQSREIAAAMSGALREYKTVLANWWSRQSILQDDIRKLESIERELEELDERARMTVVPLKLANR